MHLSDTELALLGTLFGTAGLKVVEYVLGRKDKAQDHGAQIREELRTEVLGLRDQVAKAKESEQHLEAEIEEWRSKYYDERDKGIKGETELMLAHARIESLQQEINTCKVRLEELEKKILGEHVPE